MNNSSLTWFMPTSPCGSAEFYREFSNFYKTGYLHVGLGWEGLAAWIRRLGSFPQLWKMVRSALVMGDETYYLAGHKENWK